MNKAHKILCTLGPASMNSEVIERLDSLGVDVFRINLSHTELIDLPERIEFIQARTNVPICLDTEGAQVRTGDMFGDAAVVREDTIIRVHQRRISGDAYNINLTPMDIVDQLEIGDIITIDFDSVLTQVTGRDSDGSVLLRVLNGGRVGKNKAVTVGRKLDLPPLSPRDVESVAIGKSMGVNMFALSFASCGEDVDYLRSLAGDDAMLISKIESIPGLRNLKDIASKSDALLIDRGDLSREVALEQIPRVQKEIIRTASRTGVDVFVATNLLESMVASPSPSRAEVNDIYNTLLDGANGLVLAAETAIGNYPVQCASMIVRMIRGFEAENSLVHTTFAEEPVSLLVEPHGGKLVQAKADASTAAMATQLPRLQVPLTALMDCEQIAQGVFSPIDGFLDRKSLESVLSENRLPCGTAWTMPIILQVPEDKANEIGVGDRVALTDEVGYLHSVLDVTEIFRVDIEDTARRWFGTDSVEHPGVKRVVSAGNVLVAGKVQQVGSLTCFQRNYQLTPLQTRQIFAHKGWSRVVGFHTRNPVHRGHEHVQLRALEQTGADGLFINPAVGPKKHGDFMPEPIMLSYQVAMEFGFYPTSKVVLGSFCTYPRYAGPREAIFTALARKNMGCSHFIVGRDHAGVGNFYEKDANQKIFDQVGDIGIQPVFSEEIGYDPSTSEYGAFAGRDSMESISGSKIRSSFTGGESVPDWMMREVVQEALHRYAGSGKPLFVE